ncbi:MAG: hypothetical protein ROO76_06945 [Terriglobia bacterium]|jgi:plastocyanin|nr:hypothetical protein [Terriglobia bacterium]
MKTFLHFGLAVLISANALAQRPKVGHSLELEVKLAYAGRQRAPKDMSKSVAWLVPVSSSFRAATASDKHFRMAQKDKQFVPNLLVVPLGSYVDFPNLDPWFHNVFSLYQGKRFDLGLYQAGGEKSVQFDKSGVSYLFCNIHPQMSAVIIAVRSWWYGTSDSSGRIRIADIPPGKYELHVWHEGATQKALQSAQDTLEIAGNRTLSPVILTVEAESRRHKNKYGKDYDPDALKPDY